MNQELALLARHFPASLTATPVFDTSSFVRETIQEVERTLVAAFLLVVLVVFLFLGDWRAAVVPTVVLPIALTGTFAALLGVRLFRQHRHLAGPGGRHRHGGGRRHCGVETSSV